MTLLKMRRLDQPYLVKESFFTIKNRLVDSGMFCGITLEDRKMFINKTEVEFISPFIADVDGKDKENGKTKKDQKK